MKKLIVAFACLGFVFAFMGVVVRSEISGVKLARTIDPDPDFPTWPNPFVGDPKPAPEPEPEEDQSGNA